MTDNPNLAVLELIVELYDRRGEPLPIEVLSESLERPDAAMQVVIDHLEACHMVRTVDDSGYRPTITARELLELDLDDDALIVVETEDPD